MIIGINTLSERWPACGMHRYYCTLLNHLIGANEKHKYLKIRPDPRVYKPGLSVRKTIRAAIWELWSIQNECKRRDVELLHCPYWASPLFPSQPTVVTIPDVVPLLGVSGFDVYRRRLQSRIYYYLVTAAARRATAIISFSNSAGKDVAKVLKIQPQRIHITPLATQPECRPQSRHSVGRVIERYRLQGKYVLVMAAGFDYRKDLITAVRAFENLKRRWNKPLQLVIAGDHRRLELGASSDLRTAVQESELRLNGDIFLPGIIAREDLPALYAGAEVLLCTSIYEGFGLSVLEAMACGTPVVVSDIQVFRELCGEAALYASTGNANSFADQVFRVLSDQRESEHLAETGLNRANQYSWEETARLTVEVYENAFSER